MDGVEIHDEHPRGYLAFDLKEILGCLRQEVLERTWECCGIESTGVTAGALEALERNPTRVAGYKLVELAEQINQVVWGTFSGRLSSEVTDSLVIKAIDSTLWEVFGSSECLAKVKHAFRDVRPAGYSVS